MARNVIIIQLYFARVYKITQTMTEGAHDVTCIYRYIHIDVRKCMQMKFLPRSKTTSLQVFTPTKDVNIFLAPLTKNYCYTTFITRI